MKARCSSCHCVVNLVITDGDNPAAEPKNSVNAGAKSPLDIPLASLRDIGYWEAWRTGASRWAPAVVLTDQKERAITGWPFTLAYECFLRRLIVADRWLVAGYGMGDAPVNRLYRNAMHQRSREGREPIPPTLLVGHGQSPAALGHRARAQMRIAGPQVIAVTSGVPEVFGTPEWRTWAEAAPDT